MIEEVQNISWVYNLPESKIHLACRSLDSFAQGWRDSTDLVINHGEYVYIKMGEVFKKIGKASYEAILLNHNENANIYKDLKHISFTNLKFVDLSHNRLTSVEGINHLSMGSLEILNLSSNYIVSLRSVVKINSQEMKKFFFEDNKITSSKDLYLLDCSSLKTIDLNHNANQSIFDYVKMAENKDRKIQLQNKYTNSQKIRWGIEKKVKGRILGKFCW